MDGRAWHAFDIGVGQKQDDDGCAFILDDNSLCNAARRPGSSYCARHHERCHLPGGSAGERRRLHETEALANAVGGRRRKRPARTPPDPFLQKLEAILRRFSRPKRSRNVRSNAL